MAKAPRNLNGLVIWSIPLLLVLLLVSLTTARSQSHKLPSTTTEPYILSTSPGASLNQNVLIGVLNNLNPQLMIPVPHPGRWYLESSNSLSADLVCPDYREVIKQAFVESATLQCQVVLVALHLPVETQWKLASG